MSAYAGTPGLFTVLRVFVSVISASVQCSSRNIRKGTNNTRIASFVGLEKGEQVTKWKELERSSDHFSLRVGVITYFCWRAGGNPERWYWHRKVSGNITDSGSYASRRSARRAIIGWIKEGRA